jgi:hypothetical protein
VITARLRADGPTKVLELTEEMRAAGTEVGDETETELEMTEADDSTQEVMRTGTELSRSFSIRVEAVGVSLINSTPQELLYLSCRVRVWCACRMVYCSLRTADVCRFSIDAPSCTEC